MLDDRYELQRVIGRGGSADVYLATDQTLGREVAVKLLRTQSATETDRLRFISESRTLAALDHPHLMTVLDAGADGDHMYLVLSLIKGRSLGERPREPHPVTDVALLGAQVAEALAYAHEQGVIHRDVKPGNVLVHENGDAWLGDFGISQLVGEAVRHTETGNLIGTAAYLAPEQVRGTELTPAADVYSLGLVLLELITGDLSYPGPPVEAALARLTNGPEVPADLPQGWQRLLRRMTALEPGDRCSAVECASALQALAEGQDPAELLFADGGPPTELMASPQAGARARPAWILGAVAALVAVLIASGVVLSGGEAELDRPKDQIPVGVAADLRGPLQDLHDAVTPTLVKELPTLSAILDRLDGTIANQKYKHGRAHLANLVETVEFALENQLLDEPEAERVLAAAAALREALPKPAQQPATSPTSSPRPPQPSSASSASGDQDAQGPGASKKGAAKKKAGGKGRGTK